MIHFNLTIGTCILASTFLLEVGAQAATYFVATTGNNNNSGTSAQPWKTIAYATSRMVAGDTTYVRGGTYNEGAIRFGRSGTSSVPIKLLNVSGQYPIINFTDKTKHQILIQNLNGSNKAMAWITIEGLEIRNGYVGIKVINGQNVTIRRNWIHHNQTQGILGNATTSTIDRNRINHNGNFSLCASSPSTCNKHHGIYMHGTAITVTNNLLYDNLGNGVVLNGTISYNSSKHPGSNFALARNWVITNNTFAYQVHAAGIVVWGANCHSAKIENNIFYENRAKGDSHDVNGILFTAASSSTGIVIRNNLAFASGSGGTKFLSGGGGYTQSGNIVNAVNPGFVNAPATLPSAPNFALASGSSAINKGLTTSGTKNSYTNVSRPQQSFYDIGAFEFLNSSTSLSAPTSLQLAN